MAALAEDLGDEEDGERLVEELLELHEHPLLLSPSTPKSAFRQLPFLTAQQVDDLQDYLALHGPMRSLGELLFIPSIGPRERRWLRQFVAVEDASVRPSLQRRDSLRRPVHLRHEWQTRVDVPLYRRDGWSWQQGIAHRWRYTGQAGLHVGYGLRAESDAGEPLFCRERVLWDEMGGHVRLSDIGRMETLIIGDFKAGFGEGLVLNNGFRIGKQMTGMWRTAGGVRPHRSADEVNYLRGLAATWRFSTHGRLTALYSFRRQDATLRDDGSVQTLLTSGLHRTESELTRRHNLSVQTAAVHVAWAKGPWWLGATGLFQHYNHLFVRGTSLYQQIAPQGYLFGNASVDYGFRLSPFTVSGEVAQSFADGNHGLALLNKAAWRFNASTQLSVIQRFYSSRYYSALASAYGENSRVQNESGLCLLFDAERIGPMDLQAYLDAFYSPWPRYGMTHYSTGLEAMAQTRWQLPRHQTLTLRYRFKSKERCDRRYLSHRLRATYLLPLSSAWQLQGMALYHLFHEEGENSHGYALASRADGQWPDRRWRISLMPMWFYTTAYDARLYLYEPSLAQAFGLSNLYGRGERLAVSLRWQAADRRLSLQGKLGLTHYEDRHDISSGPTHIQSSWKTDLQLQLLYRLK